jgi:putative SOS response-associated peptidase YedK
VCGRFAFYSPDEATASLFGVSGAFPVEARYNIAPTQAIAAVRHDADRRREAVLLRWGLVPSWAKDTAIGNRMINARAETVAEKPAYRAAYRHRRCIVPADGFYEWRTTGEGKTPYYITLACGQPFAFAGLWETWQDRRSGERIDTATLITASANDFMTSLHHRMPLVLEAGTAEAWLAGNGVSELVDRTPRLRAWPVSRRVNNARNEGPDLIEPDGEILEG